jgi:hypothetical protein
MKWAVDPKNQLSGVAEPLMFRSGSFVYWEVITPGIYTTMVA